MATNFIKVLFVFTQLSLAQVSSADQDPPKGVFTSPCQQVIPDEQKPLWDYGQLCKYEDINASLPKATDHRVVYFGDSITEFWGDRIPGIKGDDVLNRGISGQTTSQMLNRFRADVINLRPKVVHILAGTNDIAGNMGPTSIARIEDAIESMAEQAQSHGIKVILASILPVQIYPWSPSIQPVLSIMDLNRWIENYATLHGIVYADYFSVLSDANRGFNSAFTFDGVHPNPDGYTAMNPVAQKALQKAIGP